MRHVISTGAQLFVHATGRKSRPPRIVIVLRGLPGAGASSSFFVCFVSVSLRLALARRRATTGTIRARERRDVCRRGGVDARPPDVRRGEPRCSDDRRAVALLSSSLDPSGRGPFFSCLFPRALAPSVRSGPVVVPPQASRGSRRRCARSRWTTPRRRTRRRAAAACARSRSTTTS